MNDAKRWRYAGATKCGAIVALLLLLSLPIDTSAQAPHLIRNGELGLDDFPVAIDGYSIQIGAFSSESSAVELKYKLISQFDDSIRLEFENDLWRVRLGAFQDSASALVFLYDKVQPAGYQDAILEHDRVLVSVDALPDTQIEPGFRLQIGVFSNPDSAVKMALDVACIFPDLHPHVLAADSVYKVQLGDFRDSTSAAGWQIEVESVESLHPFIVGTQVYGPAPPAPENKTLEKDIFEYND